MLDGSTDVIQRQSDSFGCKMAPEKRIGYLELVFGVSGSSRPEPRRRWPTTPTSPCNKDQQRPKLFCFAPHYQC